MAHQILHGHFYAFYWGQNYGGVEPYVVAALFLVLGQSSFTLGLTPVLLDVVAAVLIWRLGRRLFGPTVGVGAALLFWIWPEVYVFDSTVEYGFRFITLVCGLAVMLLAVRIYQDQTTETSPVVVRGNWIALGLLAGIGWWGSPEIMYYLLPSVALLAWAAAKKRIGIHLTDVAGAVAAAVLGSLPWLWANAKSRLGSLRKTTPQPHHSYFSHLSTFFTHTLPMVLGLRLRANPVLGREAFASGSGRFLVSPAGSSWASGLGGVLYVAALVGLGAWLVVLIRRRQALILVGAVLLYPLLYSVSPFSWDWTDGRYGLFFAPMASLLVASGAIAAFTHLRRPGLATPVAIVTALALTITAAVQLNPYKSVRGDPNLSSWTTWSTNPNKEAAFLTRALESNGLRRVWAGNSLAWLLDWQSDGGITASDVRYPNTAYYSSVVNAVRPPAWLFVDSNDAQTVAPLLNIDYRILNPGCLISNPAYCVDPSLLEGFLAREGIASRELHFGPFTAVVPSKGVGSALIAALQRTVPSQSAFDIASGTG